MWRWLEDLDDRSTTQESVLEEAGVVRQAEVGIAELEAAVAVPDAVLDAEREVADTAGHHVQAVDQEEEDNEVEHFEEEAHILDRLGKEAGMLAVVDDSLAETWDPWEADPVMARHDLHFLTRGLLREKLKILRIGRWIGEQQAKRVACPFAGRTRLPPCRNFL